MIERQGRVERQIEPERGGIEGRERPIEPLGSTLQGRQRAEHSAFMETEAKKDMVEGRSPGPIEQGKEPDKPVKDKDGKVVSRVFSKHLPLQNYELVTFKMERTAHRAIRKRANLYRVKQQDVYNNLIDMALEAETGITTKSYTDPEIENQALMITALKQEIAQKEAENEALRKEKVKDKMAIEAMAKIMQDPNQVKTRLKDAAEPIKEAASMYLIVEKIKYNVEAGVKLHYTDRPWIKILESIQVEKNKMLGVEDTC